jgi:hypothetical protein
VEEMIKKVSLVLLLVLASIVVTSVTAYEVAEWYQMQITLVNQKPDPVSPGEYVEVRFKIENRGTKNAEDITFELLPSFPFSLEPGEEAVKKVGSVWGRQIGDLGVMVKYKLIVDKEAVEGTNYIKARYKIMDGSWATIEFNMSIQTRTAMLGIQAVTLEPEIVAPGEVARLSISLENLVSSVIENIRLKLDLSSVSFAPVNSSNEKLVRSIEPGEKDVIDFILIAESDADADVYKVPITLHYEDELGNNYSTQNTLGLQIGDKPDLLVSIETTTIYLANTHGTVTIKFVNRGLADIKLLSAKLGTSDDYEILNSDEVYVGNIDSDDYETADFDIYVNNVKQGVELPLSIAYRDANNNQYQKTYRLELKIYSKREAEKMGLKKASNLVGVLIVIAIVGVGIYWYKFRRKKKKE